MNEFKISGAVYEDQFTFSTSDLLDPITTAFTTIKESSPVYNSSHSDGVIGLAPSSRILSTPHLSFVNRLKESQHIDSSIMAIYVDKGKTGDGAATIQFGGWDPAGIHKD